MFLGKKVQSRLCPLHEPTPGPASGAEGDFRLGDVIARPKGVGAWINERVDAPELVVFQQLPRCSTGLEHGSDEPEPGRSDYCEIGPVYTGQKHQPATRRHQQDRGTEIRLL